jgi:hypothetical protein
MSLHRFSCCCDDKEEEIPSVAAIIHYGPASIHPQLFGYRPHTDLYDAPCSPWCLHDENFIHPEVNADDYLIDNEYVVEVNMGLTGDGEPNIVRRVPVGLEVFIQPITTYTCVERYETCGDACDEDDDGGGGEDLTGACCFCNDPEGAIDFCLDNVREGECNELGGEFQGVGTQCDDQVETGEKYPEGHPKEGELIKEYEDPECLQLFAARQLNPNGWDEYRIPRGINVDGPCPEVPLKDNICKVFCDIDQACSVDPCLDGCEPVVGACCKFGSCSEKTREECALSIGGPGKYLGDNIPCSEGGSEFDRCACEPFEIDFCDEYADVPNRICSYRGAWAFSQGLMDKCIPEGSEPPLICAGFGFGFDSDPLPASEAFGESTSACRNCIGQCCALTSGGLYDDKTAECTQSTWDNCLGKRGVNPDGTRTQTSFSIGVRCNADSWPGDYTRFCECYGPGGCPSQEATEAAIEYIEGGGCIYPCERPVTWSCCGGGGIGDCRCASNCSGISRAALCDDGLDDTFTEQGSCCKNGSCSDQMFSKQCCSVQGGSWSTLSCADRRNSEENCARRECLDFLGSCCRDGQCQDGVRKCECLDACEPDSCDYECGPGGCGFNIDWAFGGGDGYGRDCKGIDGGIIDLDSYYEEQIDDYKAEGLAIWSENSCACRKKTVRYPTPYCPVTDQPTCPPFGLGLAQLLPSGDVGGPGAIEFTDPETGEVGPFREYVLNKIGIPDPAEIPRGRFDDPESPVSNLTQARTYAEDYINSLLDGLETWCCRIDSKLDDAGVQGYEYAEPPVSTYVQLYNRFCKSGYYVLKWPERDPGDYNSLNDVFDDYYFCDTSAGDGPCIPFTSGNSNSNEAAGGNDVAGGFQEASTLYAMASAPCVEYGLCGFDPPDNRPCVDDRPGGAGSTACDCECKMCIANCVEYDWGLSEADDGEDEPPEIPMGSDPTVIPEGLSGGFDFGYPRGIPDDESVKPTDFTHCADLDGQLNLGGYPLDDLEDILDDLEQDEQPEDTDPRPNACPPPPPDCGFTLPFEHVYTTSNIECVKGTSDDKCNKLDLEGLCTEEKRCYSEPFVGWKLKVEDDPSLEEERDERVEEGESPYSYDNNLGGYIWNNWIERDDGITQYLFDKLIERFGPLRLPSGRINPFPDKIYFSFDPEYVQKSEKRGIPYEYAPWKWVLRNLYEKIREEYDTVDEDDDNVVGITGGDGTLYYPTAFQVAYNKFNVYSTPTDFISPIGGYYYCNESFFDGFDTEFVNVPAYGATGPDPNVNVPWGSFTDSYLKYEYPSCRGNNQFGLARAAGISGPIDQRDVEIPIGGIGGFDYMTSHVDLVERHYGGQDYLEAKRKGDLYVIFNGAYGKGRQCVKGRAWPEADFSLTGGTGDNAGGPTGAEPLECGEKICNPFAGEWPRILGLEILDIENRGTPGLSGAVY